MPDKAIHSLAVDGDRAWAGTSTGIAQFRGGKLERTLANGLLAKSIAVHKAELLVRILLDDWGLTMLVGSIPWAIIVGGLGYWGSVKFITAYRREKAARRARQAAS